MKKPEAWKEAAEPLNREAVGQAVRARGDLSAVARSLLLPEDEPTGRRGRPSSANPNPKVKARYRYKKKLAHILPLRDVHAALITRKHRNLFDSPDDERWTRELLADALRELIEGKRIVSRRRGGQHKSPAYERDLERVAEKSIAKLVADYQKYTNDQSAVRQSELFEAWHASANSIRSILDDNKFKLSEKDREAFEAVHARLVADNEFETFQGLLKTFGLLKEDMPAHRRRRRRAASMKKMSAPISFDDAFDRVTSKLIVGFGFDAPSVKQKQRVTPRELLSEIIFEQQLTQLLAAFGGDDNRGKFETLGVPLDSLVARKIDSMSDAERLAELYDRGLLSRQALSKRGGVKSSDLWASIADKPIFDRGRELDPKRIKVAEKPKVDGNRRRLEWKRVRLLGNPDSASASKQAWVSRLRDHLLFIRNALQRLESIKLLEPKNLKKINRETAKKDKRVEQLLRALDMVPVSRLVISSISNEQRITRGWMIAVREFDQARPAERTEKAKRLLELLRNHSIAMPRRAQGLIMDLCLRVSLPLN